MRLGLASPLDLGVLGHLMGEPLAERCTTDVPFISHLVKHLSDKVESLTVFTFSFDVSEITIRNVGCISVYICPHRRSARELGLSFFNAEVGVLRKAIQMADVEVVHAHWTYEYALAALESKIPTLVTIHDAPWKVVLSFKNIYRTLRLLMAYKVSFGARCLSAVSPYAANHWRRFMLYRGRSLEVIPNGLAPRANVGPRKGPLNRSGRFSVLSVNSGWGQGKNTGTLIKAFAEIRGTYPDAKLFLVGYGHGPNEEASRWAERKGLSEGVQFLGQIRHDKIMDILERNVDVYVHPSKMEQCCMAIIEAMSYAVPVVGGSKSGGVPWQLGYGRYGALVDVSSPSKIAEAVIHILEDPGRYRCYSERSHEGFKKEFSLPTIVERYLASYHRVLASC